MDPRSSFVSRFGNLVASLRVDPGNDAAQDLALTAAAAAVATAPITVDAGVETSEPADPLSLQARLLARQVDTLRVAAGAEHHELLALARALSHDTTPLPSTPAVAVTLLPLLQPAPPAPPAPGSAERPSRRLAVERRGAGERRGPFRARRPGDERRSGRERRTTGERRTDLIKAIRADVVRLYDTLTRATLGRDWEGLLTAGLALARLAPAVPQADRRTFVIQVRRAVPRKSMEELIDLAERLPAARSSAADFLRWLGLDAAEAMLERLATSQAPGPRAFLIDALGGMRDAYPLVVPLLRDSAARALCLGATLIGRLGRAEGAVQLRQHLRHPDPEVRTAVVRALGELHPAPVADALREALRHPSPDTRVAAASAIATWRDGALGLLLVAALEDERDPGAWRATVEAMGRIGSAATCAALAGIALTRRSLVRRHGYLLEQRLLALAALERAGTVAARHALGRVAARADRALRPAAVRAVGLQAIAAR